MSAPPRAERYARLLAELSQGRRLDAPAFDLDPGEAASAADLLDATFT